jgi:hypothetical protein
VKILQEIVQEAELEIIQVQKNFLLLSFILKPIFHVEQ